MIETARYVDNFMRTSPMVFFKPTENFWKALSVLPWRWKRYVDAGAGKGHLTRMMRERGYMVTGVDLFKREDAEVDDILEVDLTGLTRGKDPYVEFDYNDCMIFARPCHGAFVGLAMKHYYDTGEMLYISKPSNIEDDLFGWGYEIIATDVGEDGEVMCRVLYKHGLAKEFHCLDLYGNGSRHQWWQFAGNMYRNSAGGGFPSANVDPAKIVEVRQLSHYGMLYAEPLLTHNDLTTGWLAPDGTFYGCSVASHDYTAENVIGSTVKRLEQQNFARLYGDTGMGEPLFAIGRDLDWERRPPVTPAQAIVLRQKGYKIRDYQNGQVAANLVLPEKS